jgi:redox-sensitive bicupin YhaK (pirin superfamily)
MASATNHVRGKADIPVLERAGCRYRRHLAELAPRGEPITSSADGFGALRLLDDVVVSAGAGIRFEAHDGFEAVVYVLEGECLIGEEGGQTARLLRNGAAYARLGRGVQHHLRNPSDEASPRVLVAAVVAQSSNPSPTLAVRSLPEDGPDLIWIASDDPADRKSGSLRLDSSVRLGIATLDPGAESEFSRAVDRGLYLCLIEGMIELGSGFVEEGGDARMSLQSPVRVQGVTRARIFVANVALGFAQELE